MRKNYHKDKDDDDNDVHNLIMKMQMKNFPHFFNQFKKFQRWKIDGN